MRQEEGVYRVVGVEIRARLAERRSVATSLLLSAGLRAGVLWAGGSVFLEITEFVLTLTFADPIRHPSWSILVDALGTVDPAIRMEAASDASVTVNLNSKRGSHRSNRWVLLRVHAIVDDVLRGVHAAYPIERVAVKILPRHFPETASS